MGQDDARPGAHARSNRFGRGLHIYANPAAAALVDRVLANTLVGRDAMAIAECRMAMLKSIRNLDRPGIVSMAIAAVDSALSDLKARLLRVPLVKLLGAARESVPIYGSGGFTSYSVKQLQEQLAEWWNAEFRE
jgi:L-alanine-DL-glutamate epimerase-like enolase superfamily enzyme